MVFVERFLLVQPVNLFIYTFIDLSQILKIRSKQVKMNEDEQENMFDNLLEDLDLVENDNAANRDPQTAIPGDPSNKENFDFNHR